MSYGIANTSGQPDMDELVSIIRLASEQDVWFYDTAQSYGDSETLLGKAFSQLGVNEQVKCITKIHPDMDNQDTGTLVEAVRQSIQRLHVRQLWGLLAHRVEQTRDTGIIKAVDQAKDEGLVRLWGVSVYDPEDAMDMVKNESIDIIQLPFNILDRRLLDCGFFEAVREYGKKVLIRSVFLQGLLFLKTDELWEKGMEWAKPQLEEFRMRFNALEVSIESFAIQAVSKTVPDGMIILGVEKVSQLEKNLRAFKSPVISKELIDDWWENLPAYPERLLNPSLW
jgi:aryl-alcohol dehydrogenase-like predicted oxidoreductase